MFSEIFYVLHLDIFLAENGKIQYDQFIECVMCLQDLFQNKQINQIEIEMKWNECQLLSCTLDKFVKKDIEQNIEFAFWNKFLT